jgi:hypothetical protein
MLNEDSTPGPAWWRRQASNAGPTGVFTATCVLGGSSAVELRLFCEGLAITISQQGVRYEDGRVTSVTAIDDFTGSRTWGVVAQRFVPVGNDHFLDEDRAFLRAVRTGTGRASSQRTRMRSGRTA